MKITKKNIKVLDKIKKGLIGIGGFLLTIPTKVLAMRVDDTMMIVPLYGPAKEPPKPSVIEIISKIARDFMLPIVLLVGIIIYFKKGEDGRKKRILMSIGIILLITVLYFAINDIIK